MNIIDSFLFGIVEGITEFLPISSTGHLILTARLLHIPQTNFIKSYEIAIQLGAILSVIVLYWKSLVLDARVIKRVIAAFIPTAVIGFLFYKIIIKSLMGNEQVVLWSLFLGGIFLIVFERYHREPQIADEAVTDIPLRSAILIGIFQSFAVIPGVSRAAATIIGGLILGLKRKTTVEFSFLLAVPTMLAATSLDLLKNARVFSIDQTFSLIVGFVSSFIVALFCIKFLLRYIRQNNFILFGIYRILIALIFWFIVK